MGISLNGLTPANTYQSLIKVGDNSQLTATLKTLSDGFGTDLPMQVSTSGVNFTGTLTQNGLPITTTPSGVSGAIQFSDGSAFASDAANLFWDDTNNRLGIGTNAPLNVLQVKTTQANANGSIGFTNTSAATIIALTDTGSAVTQLQFRASSYNFTDCNGVRISQGGYGNVPTAMVQVIGSGSTSATTSLLVQNSASADLLSVLDDGKVGIGTNAPNSLLNVIGSGSVSGIRVNTFGADSWMPFSDGNWYIRSNGTIINDNSNAGVSIGVNSPTTARLLVKGSGSTSATTSLLVQNSAGTEAFKIQDDRRAVFSGLTEFSNNVQFLAAQDTSGLNNMRFVVPGASKSFLINADYSNTNEASALLEVQSTTKGFLPPKMTTTQKNAISSPASGLMVYDTTTNKLCCYNGSTWNDLF